MSSRLLLSLLALLLTSCTLTPQTPLRVGTNVWIGYESLYLARSLDYIRPEHIHLAELSSATAVQHALEAGELDAACLTLDEALGVRARGLDIQILLVMDISDGADVLLAHPPIDSLEKLRGRTVGVEKTAVGAILLDGALRAAGLGEQDVTLRYLSVDEHEAAFRAGQVDAVVTFEPVRTRLLDRGAIQLFDSSRIPGDIVDVLVAPRAVVASRGDDLRRLVAAHFRALAYYRQHPRDASQRMAPRLRVAPEKVPDLYRGIRIPDRAENRRLLAGSPPPLLDTARRLVAIMQRIGLLRTPPALAGLTTAEFVQPEGD